MFSKSLKKDTGVSQRLPRHHQAAAFKTKQSIVAACHSHPKCFIWLRLAARGGGCRRRGQTEPRLIGQERSTPPVLVQYETVTIGQLVPQALCIQNRENVGW
jgi:hypothetical protein